MTESDVLKYLDGRKTAATIKQVSKFFICSNSHASKILSELERKGLVKCIRAGGTKLYVVEDKLRNV